MITYKAKSLWMGRIAIPDKYVKDALSKQEDLEIHYRGQRMTIPADKIQQEIKARSERAFLDRFSNETYYLYYFNFKPDKEVQQS